MKRPSNRLLPDLPVTRTVIMHRLEDPRGETIWQGRLLSDLIEHIAFLHQEGVLVQIDRDVYRMTVLLQPKGEEDG